MNTTEAEKDWLRRISRKEPSDTAEKQAKKVAKEAVEQNPTPLKKKGNGFGDVAGMNELKKIVTEGFINVLQNRECAEIYGIKPPSMLFYGPAGCGKTFFAEKMAEEVGINFMKIVPDDLACTWVHGTQQKIGEVFKDAEKNDAIGAFAGVVYGKGASEQSIRNSIDNMFHINQFIKNNECEIKALRSSALCLVVLCTPALRSSTLCSVVLCDKFEIPLKSSFMRFSGKHTLSFNSDNESVNPAFASGTESEYGIYGFMSYMGVPSIRSTPDTYMSGKSIFSSFTTDNPILFGRNGERVANTPIRLFPPSLGGRTVGDQSPLSSSLCDSEKSHRSHMCEKPSRP